MSLESSAYERLRAAKRPGESFSMVVNRILEGTRPSFHVLAGVLTNADAVAVRKTVAVMREREAVAERSRLKSVAGGRRGRIARH